MCTRSLCSKLATEEQIGAEEPDGECRDTVSAPLGNFSRRFA